MRNRFSNIRNYAFFQTVTIRHHAESQLQHTLQGTFTSDEYTSSYGLWIWIYDIIHFYRQQPYVIQRNMNFAVRHYVWIDTEIRSNTEFRMTNMRYHADNKH